MRTLELVGILAISLATYAVYGFSWTGWLVGIAATSLCVVIDLALGVRS